VLPGLKSGPISEATATAWEIVRDGTFVALFVELAVQEAFEKRVRRACPGG
jgi:hypothetical protein